MKVKIDSEAVVPLGWVLSGLATLVGVTAAGVFWVSTVNFRLERIEQKLGIPKIEASAFYIQDANASSRKKDVTE